MGSRDNPYFVDFTQYFGKRFRIDFTHGNIRCPQCSGNACKHEFLAIQGDNIKKVEKDLKITVKKSEIERINNHWSAKHWLKRMFI